MSTPAKFVSRAAWGAGPRGATRSSHPIGATKGVTAHWEGPGMGDFPHDVCARKVRTIQRFHKGKGWADIAYNAIVCPHGYVFEGRGPGVTSAANGNTQTNADWYAVCYLGGVGDPFTAAAMDGFREARQWLRSDGAAGVKVNGHRDHKATACPGDTIYAWVHSGAWAKGTSSTSTPNEGVDDMAGLADQYPAWYPGDKDSSDKMPLDQQLQQARGYAQEAYKHAKAANTRATRLEKALEALGNGLGAEVGKAVREALADSVVDVDVTVTGGSK